MSVKQDNYRGPTGETWFGFCGVPRGERGGASNFFDITANKTTVLLPAQNARQIRRDPLICVKFLSKLCALGDTKTLLSCALKGFFVS